MPSQAAEVPGRQRLGPGWPGSPTSVVDGVAERISALR